MNLQPADFIKMMITQLQNQDPMSPTSNQDLLAQMSQIGSLQSSTDLQSTLKTFGTTSQIGSASNLIGKEVSGLDDANDPVQGVVDSVKVVDGAAVLQLHNGSSLSMANVTSIAPATTSTTGTTGK